MSDSMFALKIQKHLVGKVASGFSIMKEVFFGQNFC